VQQCIDENKTTNIGQVVLMLDTMSETKANFMLKISSFFQEHYESCTHLLMTDEVTSVIMLSFGCKIIKPPEIIWTNQQRCPTSGTYGSHLEAN